MEAEMSSQHEFATSGNASAKVSPQQLYQHDPLLILLKDKLHLNNIRFFAGSLVLSALCFFGLHVLTGTPFGLGAILFRLVEIFSSVLFYMIYFSLPSSIAALFNTLDDNQVIGEPLGSELYQDFLDKLVLRINNSSLLILITLPLVIFYLLYRFFVPPPLAPTYPPLWLVVVNALIDFSVAYPGILSIMRISVSLFFLNRLFHAFTICINPLHSDGAGGLGSLKYILWYSAGIMLGVALAFYEGSSFSNSVLDLVLLILAYAVLIPSLLLGWLVLPHRVMMKARNTLLQPLADEFQQIIMQPQPWSGEDANAIKGKTDRLAEIKRRYDLVREVFPTWPLEIVQMRSLLVAFILPVLIAFISVIPTLIDAFLKKP